MTIRQANDLIEAKHRHHKRVQGHRFTIGALADGELVGAAVTGRPVARNTSQYSVAEVTRLVADGTPHICSMLYAASARVAVAVEGLVIAVIGFVVFELMRPILHDLDDRLTELELESVVERKDKEHSE